MELEVDKQVADILNKCIGLTVENVRQLDVVIAEIKRLNNVVEMLKERIVYLESGC